LKENDFQDDDSNNDDEPFWWWNRRGSNHHNNSDNDSTDTTSFKSEEEENGMSNPSSHNNTNNNSNNLVHANGAPNDDDDVDDNHDDNSTQPTLNIGDDDETIHIDDDDDDYCLKSSLPDKDTMKDKNFLRRLLAGAGGKARQVGGRILLLRDMLEMHIKGVRRLKPWEVGIIVACLVYILNPADLLLDALPCGFADDIVVLAVVVSRLSLTIRLFRLWKKTNPDEFQKGKELPWFDRNNRNMIQEDEKKEGEAEAEAEAAKKQGTHDDGVEENFENCWNVIFDDDEDASRERRTTGEE